MHRLIPPTASARGLLIVPLALVALVLAAAGCGERENATPAAGAGPAVGATRGAVAPDFALEMVDGGTLRLSELRGRAVLVDFWDTWCPPCRRALPHLQALQDEYGDRLTVVGVAFGRDGRQAVSRFLADRGLTFANVFMDERYDTARAYGGVQSLPTTFLIDPEGVIRQIWVGGQEKDVYAAAVREVIGA